MNTYFYLLRRVFSLNETKLLEKGDNKQFYLTRKIIFAYCLKTMKKNGIFILLVCFLSIILLGCNTNDSEKTGKTQKSETKKTETMDVCSLITKEEASTAIGMAVEDGEFTEQEVLGQKMCFYEGKEDTLVGQPAAK